MKEVGFIGLGAMGAPMAVKARRARLLRCAASTCGRGARCAGASRRRRAPRAPPRRARDADALVLMVVNGDQARRRAVRRRRACGACAGAVVILMATCTPRRRGERIAERGRGERAPLLDAPVSGGVVGATGGTLTIMAAARNDVFAAARPLLDGARRQASSTSASSPGQGAMVKTINQLLCGVHIAAAAEAMLAGRAGRRRSLRDRCTRSSRARPASAGCWRTAARA